jgi:hypothetical protein
VGTMIRGLEVILAHQHTLVWVEPSTRHNGGSSNTTRRFIERLLGPVIDWSWVRCYSSMIFPGASMDSCKTIPVGAREHPSNLMWQSGGRGSWKPWITLPWINFRAFFVFLIIDL